MVLAPGTLAEILSIGLREMSGGLICEPISEISMVDETGRPMPMGKMVVRYHMRPIQSKVENDPEPQAPARTIERKFTLIQGGKE